MMFPAAVKTRDVSFLAASHHTAPSTARVQPTAAYIAAVSLYLECLYAEIIDNQTSLLPYLLALFIYIKKGHLVITQCRSILVQDTLRSASLHGK